MVRVGNGICVWVILPAFSAYRFVEDNGLGDEPVW